MDYSILKALSRLRKYEAVNRFFIFFATTGAWLFYAVYPLGIIYSYMFRRDIFAKIIIIPALCFGVTTLIRKTVNRRRPHYDDIKPLFAHKEGESFPSRHTSSAFIIAFGIFFINPFAGGILFLWAAFVAFARVYCAVHYFTDILGGFFVAFAFSFLFFV